jgi:hypothetical protein
MVQHHALDCPSLQATCAPSTCHARPSLESRSRPSAGSFSTHLGARRSRHTTSWLLRSRAAKWCGTVEWSTRTRQWGYAHTHGSDGSCTCIHWPCTAARMALAYCMLHCTLANPTITRHLVSHMSSQECVRLSCGHTLINCSVSLFVPRTHACMHVTREHARSHGMRGACVVHAWCMRGACVVHAWCMRGACVVHAHLCLELPSCVLTCAPTFR